LNSRKEVYDAIAEGSGLYRVFEDGVEVSQHSQERKAQESAVEHKLEDPCRQVYYDHDYRVRIDAPGCEEPELPPELEPEPPPLDLGPEPPVELSPEAPSNLRATEES